MPTLEHFESLQNDLGLVRMQILKDFAPYSPDPDLGYPVAGFPPDVALRIYGLQAGVPVDEDLKPIALQDEAPPPPEPSAPGVEIPDNWQDHHVLVKARIAKALIGENRKITEPEMDAIIAAEVERRSKEDGTS